MTESFELPATLMSKVYWAFAGRRRSRRNAYGMRQTLERIKIVVESQNNT